ncbi:hypothetical protein QVD17_42466 [Tagetes erecta]|uniref:Uncharacterized protein n=1 Tax=Tagetes erecta TaxID=13708 RepID=A0AAD8JL96_TARER|nr:hypothetical protein QVD17_42466 [Tagetes erecta]
MLWTPLFSGFFQRKGPYLFYSVGKNGTIFVRRNKEKQIYSILDKYQYAMYLFEVLERKMHLGLTYSATWQIYWVIWDFPVFSPIEISSVSPTKDSFNHQKFGA